MTKGIEVYCRKCGDLIADEVNIMSPQEFKRRYGDFCKRCGHSFSNDFTLKESGRKIT